VPIALDIGNVLCTVDLDPFIAKAGEVLGWTELRVNALCNAARHDIGITDIVADFRDEFHLNGLHILPEDLAALRESWMICVHPVPEIAELLDSILEEGDQIALLSNIGRDHVEMIRTSFPSVYNRCIQHFSCEVGARKPSKLFFQSFLWERPEFRGCIYLDDRLENVEAAKRAGFRAQVFDLDTFKKDSKSATLAMKRILCPGEA
jgi:FMN phosphatase YigB (HAD superfamily)